ncbi:MAG: 16S rRNA (uracil(1498)-N(3))-methyltransferase [Planctomycetes bacterium]|nr:16S rRNA (uracil(1498)-N(3))-methyltransferase [Planctomycetota bacterium]
MANLYHLQKLPAPGEASLDGDVAHHLLRVLRVREGEQVTLADGRGRTAIATVRSVGRRELVCAVDDHREHAPPRPHVTVAFACPRPARADWLIEHGTEVGVAVFQPLWTERSRPQAVRAERWRKVALAAAGQCARPFLPEVRQPLELATFLATFLAGDLPARRWLADQDGEPLQRGDDGPAVLLVGPEGGFTPAEREQARAHAFHPARFAAHILRTETAALVGAALLLTP